MNPTAPGCIRFALVGLGEHTRHTLTTYLTGHPRASFTLSEPEQAQVMIVDYDNPEIQRGWDALREQQPDLPVVALTVREDSPEGTTRIGKPIKGAELLVVLQQVARPAVPAAPGTSAPDTSGADTSDRPDGAPIAEQVEAPAPGRHAALGPGSRVTHQARTQSTRSVVDQLKTSERATILSATAMARPATPFDHARTYVGVVQRVLADVRKDGRTRAIESVLQYGQAVIVSKRNGGSVHAVIRDRTLRMMALVPTDKQEVDVRIMTGDEEAGAAALPAVSANEFLWKLASWTARGNLPNQIRPSDTIRQRHWPNLTRLESLPNAMRMAAFWAQGPSTPAQTASTLNLDPADVANFCYAMHVVGLLELSSPTAGATGNGAPAKVSAEQTRRRSLFSRIITHLLK